MASLAFKRVTAVPVTYEANTMYIVSNGTNFADIYFSNLDGTALRRQPTQADITSWMSQSIADFSNIQVVATIAARNALAGSRNVLALVLDATDDATITSGAALYVYDVASTTWTKVSEFESMDVVLEWSAIQNKPASTVAAIDDAVAKAHVHANKVVIDLLSDASGELQYNGAGIKARLDAVEW